MIKKLLSLFIFGLCAVGVTFGYTENYNCYNSYAGTGRCYELSPNESFVIGNYTNSVGPGLNFSDGTYKFFQMENLSSDQYTSLYWSGNGIRSFSNAVKSWGNYAYYGEIGGYCVYNGTDPAGMINRCFLAENSSSSNYENAYLYYTTPFSELDLVFGDQVMSKVVFANGGSLSSVTMHDSFVICGVYESIGKSFCVTPYPADNANRYLQNLYSTRTQLMNETPSQSSVITMFGSNFSSSPLGGSSGGGGSGGGASVSYGSGATIIGSEESAIQYFEDYYGRDKNICYVGVDNVTTLYGTNGVSFQSGTGLSIFETFNSVYSNSDLDKVYVWLNSRLINYEQWFLRSGDPLYLANYNSGTNQVDIYYDNLTFPFSGKPVAYYFMTDNIEGYYEPQGSEIVSYCNLKINNGTYDEIIDQATKNNIDKYSERSNINIGLNSDGSKKDTPDFGLFTGDAWVSSGVEIAFSGNTTLKNTLKEFFTAFDNALDGLDINTSNRILPTWLVSAFLFVVLFKFLRKRK